LNGTNKFDFFTSKKIASLKKISSKLGATLHRVSKEAEFYADLKNV
jgi:hypothetical protein